MKITQLSTSSSSSSGASTSIGDQRTPPPTEIPPSQSNVAGPLPNVDSAVMQRLESILNNIPTGTDPTAILTALETRLGISRSEEPVSSSRPRTETPSASPSSHIPNPTSRNSPPSLPKTNSPIKPSPSPTAQPSPLSPTFSHPIQPVQYASDKEEEWMAYEQPFAIPSPARSVDSTPVHDPHLTEAGGKNDEEVEDFHPLPADREAEGNAFHFEEGEPKKEKEPPRCRTRRMTNDQLLETAAVMRADRSTREEVPEVQRPRVRWSILDEVDEEMPAYQGASEAVDEREVAEDSLVREERERKRKGMESVPPLPKKIRPASQGIVFTDTDQPTPLAKMTSAVILKGGSSDGRDHPKGNKEGLQHLLPPPTLTSIWF